MDRAVVHSSTFGQNVLAMTAGLATLHTIDAESIVEHAATVGGGADRRAARRSPSRHELVHEVRGRGLMIGIEFSRPRSMRLRAQWTLLETMRTGLVHADGHRAAVPRPRHPHPGRGRPSERAEDPAAAHHHEEQAEEFVDAFDDVLAELERSLGLLFGVGRSLAIPAISRQPLVAVRSPGRGDSVPGCSDEA